jgi:hypothetical protein
MVLINLHQVSKMTILEELNKDNPRGLIYWLLIEHKCLLKIESSKEMYFFSALII